MARAISIGVFERTNGTIANRITEKHNVMYLGSDVPGGVDYDVVTIENIDYSQTPAQIISFQAAAIRTRATSIGRTVGTNEVLLPDIAKG